MVYITNNALHDILFCKMLLHSYASPIMIYSYVKIKLCLLDHHGSREDRLKQYMTFDPVQ